MPRPTQLQITLELDLVFTVFKIKIEKKVH